MQVCCTSTKWALQFEKLLEIHQNLIEHTAILVVIDWCSVIPTDQSLNEFSHSSEFCMPNFSFRSGDESSDIDYSSPRHFQRIDIAWEDHVGEIE